MDQPVSKTARGGQLEAACGRPRNARSAAAAQPCGLDRRHGHARGDARSGGVLQFAQGGVGIRVGPGGTQLALDQRPLGLGQMPEGRSIRSSGLSI